MKCTINVEEKIFHSIRDFNNAIKIATKNSLTHMKLEEGVCILKPLKGPITNCKLLLTCYEASGNQVTYRFIYIGGTYDSMFTS